MTQLLLPHYRRWEPWCTEEDTWYIVKTGQYSFMMVHETGTPFDWTGYLSHQMETGQIKKR